MLLLAVLAFAVPVACREKPPEIKNPEILGAWQGGGQTVVLFKDGTITLATNWKITGSTGNYEFIDDDTITVKFKGSLPQDFNVSLSGDNLLVTGTDGTLIGEYKRVGQAEAQGVGGGKDSD
jgi:hypothetical protein